MTGIIQIKPCRLEDVELLTKVAAQDGHAVIAPAYIVYKDDKIIGCIGVVPSVLLWLDTDQTKIRDSLVVQNFYENILRAAGNGIISLPCVEKSPLRPFIERVGYVDSGHTKLFFKTL